MEDVAKGYKAGQLDNVYFELFCLIAYNETKSINGANEIEIKNSIEKIIKERCGNLGTECFEEIDARILNRINYVIFPIWQFDKLLDDFMKRVGSS